MANKFEKRNNFEQKEIPESLQILVATQNKEQFKKLNERNDRLRSYPAAIEEYLELPFEDRMTTAISIYCDEAGSPYRTYENKPITIHSFDISALTDVPANSVKASIAYSPGSLDRWGDTYKHSHLQVSITSIMDEFSSTDQLGDLEMIPHYKGSYVVDYYKFKVAGIKARTARSGDYEYKTKYVTGPDDPLFQDIVNIVDTGVVELYKSKLNGQIRKLGSVAVNQETGE